MGITRFWNLESINMEILEAGEVVLGRWWKAENICSPFTRIYVVTDGTGYIEHDSETLTMTKDNVYIIPAGTTISFHCEEGFTKIYFHISLRQQNGYDIFEKIKQCFSFNDPKLASLIKQNFTSDSITKIIQIKSYLYSIVYQCISQKKVIKNSQYSDLILEAISFINQNLSSQLSVEKIAAGILVSPIKLRKAFKSEMKVPIGKYIDDLIMVKAENKVRQGTLSISEISEELGFSDQFYFSRCFSKKFGMPPLKYRKTNNYTKK